MGPAGAHEERVVAPCTVPLMLGQGRSHAASCLGSRLTPVLLVAFARVIPLRWSSPVTESGINPHKNFRSASRHKHYIWNNTDSPDNVQHLSGARWPGPGNVPSDSASCAACSLVRFRSHTHTLASTTTAETCLGYNEAIFKAQICFPTCFF